MELEDQVQDRKCRTCDILWAGIGILFSGVLLYIAIDLVTDGRLTSMWNSRETEESYDNGDE